MSQDFQAITTRRDEAQGFLERMVSKGIGWARKYSLFTYPYATACCGMEYMSLSSARYDIAGRCLRTRAPAAR